MDRIRVLIADDEDTVRETLAKVIGSDPSLDVVGLAADAQHAIELAAASRPDVALVDVRMPGGGGPRVAREVSLLCPPTRVVALSAFEDRQSVLRMLSAGARGYVGKAAGNDEILRAVHGTAEGTTELTQGAMNELFNAATGILGQRKSASDPERQRRRIERIIAHRAVDFAFQPIVELSATLPVVGVEAFVRFRTRPSRPPRAWYQQATRFGLLQQLELTAIDAAIEQLDRIPAGVYLALTVTPETAQSSGFVTSIGRADPERIVVQLSERGGLEDDDGLNDSLDRLRVRGTRVAVDDTWADHASLRHVVRLAPDVVKLATTITREIVSDRSRQALVASLLRFATGIGAAVVAKGVESERELLALRRLGIRYAQGDYLARPGRVPDEGTLWGRAAFDARAD